MTISAAHPNVYIFVSLVPNLVVRVKLRLRSCTGSLLPRTGTGHGPRFVLNNVQVDTCTSTIAAALRAAPNTHALSGCLNLLYIILPMISKRQQSSWLPAVALLSFLTSLATALSGQEPMKSVEEARGYNPGEIIPVSCLNRTMYVSTSYHQLQECNC